MSGRNRQRVSSSGDVIEDIKSVAANLPDLVNRVVNRVIEAEIENEKHLEFETWFKTVVSNTGFNGDIDIFSNAFRKEFEVYMVQLNRVNSELSTTGRRKPPQKRVVQEQESESSTSNDDESRDESEAPAVSETGKRPLPPSTKKTPKYFVKRRKLDFVPAANSSVNSSANDVSSGDSSESESDEATSTSSDMGFSDSVPSSGSSGGSDDDSDFEIRLRKRDKVKAKGTRSSRRINPDADMADEEEEETNKGKLRKIRKQGKTSEPPNERKSLRKKKPTKN